MPRSAMVRLAMALSLACAVLPHFGGAQTNAGTLTLGQGQNGLYGSALYDGMIYYGTNTIPGQISKVQTSTFTQVDVLRFNSSALARFHAVIVDPGTPAYLYAGYVECFVCSSWGGTCVGGRLQTTRVGVE